MKKRRWICLALTAALTIGMLAGCGQKKDLSDGGEKKKLQKVTLNEVAHSIFYAPMYVAIEEGYFKEEGIDLTLVTGFGADKTVTAVLAGEADIGFMGSESTIYTKNGGAEDYLINFAQLTQRAGNFLVAREPIENFEWWHSSTSPSTNSPRFMAAICRTRSMAWECPCGWGMKWRSLGPQSPRSASTLCSPRKSMSMSASSMS